MIKIVVEGGCVRDVYCDSMNEPRYELLDLDNHYSPTAYDETGAAVEQLRDDPEFYEVLPVR